MLFFTKVNLSDQWLMRQIYRLRYQVYCHEYKFIDPAQCPDYIESDQYDKTSAHFAAINSEGQVVGSMRMILNESVLLPIEQVCPSAFTERKIPSDQKTAEISRLVISKRLRKDFLGMIKIQPEGEGSANLDNNIGFLRHACPVFLGLCEEIYKECQHREVTRLYALMEQSLCLLLRSYGFKWQRIGEVVNHYGSVYPYTSSVAHLKKSLQTWQTADSKIPFLLQQKLFSPHSIPHSSLIQ